MEGRGCWGMGVCLGVFMCDGVMGPIVTVKVMYRFASMNWPSDKSV